MLWQRALLASLLAMGAEAGLVDVVVEHLAHRTLLTDTSSHEASEGALALRGLLRTRQSAEATNNAPLNPDGTLDVAAWDEAANKACREALRNLPEASNPSGACVCYNLPLLDSSTGTFEADLRLFQRNEPRGDFEGVPQEKIEVELSYSGASVTEVKRGPATQNAAAAAPPTAAGLSRRQDDNNTNNDNLPLLQSYLFIGQIDKDKMTNDMDDGQLQALVMPVITLKATNAAGRPVSTNVSSNEAAFLMGALTNTAMSNFTMAQQLVEIDLEGLRNGTVPFVLPGVQIMIFPIGLIITSAWLLIGLLAYGFGTYERYNFREAHRRRIAVVEKGGMRRI
ncbi:hypothetical protein VTK26DRAFT_4513 [Humicola hyalothermophila]